MAWPPSYTELHLELHSNWTLLFACFSSSKTNSNTASVSQEAL